MAKRSHSSTSRDDLETWSRDRLIEYAKKLGAETAARLTKAELVDEILLLEAPDRGAPELSLLRGLFGRARDLLASVVEKRLHLPETAELLRTIPIAEKFEPPKPRAVPTVTLAEIYAAQGHKDRAVATLRELLEREPDHDEARALMTRIETAKLAPPPRFERPEDAVDPEEAPPPPEPTQETLPEGSPESLAGLPDGIVRGDALDPLSEIVRARTHGGDETPIVQYDAPLPERYDVDECIGLPVDPHTVYVYWEVRKDTLEHFERHRPGGTLVMRTLVLEPTWDGPKSTVRDIEVYASLGDYFLRELPEGAVTRVAIGWKREEAFIPLAHSPLLESARDTPSEIAASELVRWTLRGTFPISDEDGDVESIQRAMKRHEERRARLIATGGYVGSSGRYAGAFPFVGSSERRPTSSRSA